MKTTYFQKSDIERIPSLIQELLGSNAGSAVLSSLLNRGCDDLPSHCIEISVLQFRQTAVMRFVFHFAKFPLFFFTFLCNAEQQGGIILG